ncbi:MAG: serine/threonine-protein kinase, partial [Thermoanaerobaculia bacterium]
NYMSPEQVKTTPVSTRSDLFSAGTVMYEMLTGVKPFGAPELSGILYNVVNLTPAPMENAPDALAKIVAKLMAKKPEDRYATADEALADLEAVRTARNGLDTIAVAPGDATTPLPTMLDEETRPLLRRPIHPAVFWVITLLLVSALTVTVAALRRGIAAQKPAAGLTTAQLKEWEAKERALATAEDLVEAGRFEDAIRAYDAHLARYPHSIVAQTARADAQKRLEEAMPKAEVTKVARRPKRETKEEEEPPKKKPGRWERFKRWFRGGD